MVLLAGRRPYRMVEPTTEEAMRNAILALLLFLLPRAGSTQGPAGPTRVVILGVGHSTQLVSEGQSPAALRAFFDRVSPDVMAVERPPNELARDDHYEFTYEIQYVALPYARERGIPVHGIDWIPAGEDMMLAFGVDLEEPPFVRTGWRGFLSFLIRRRWMNHCCSLTPTVIA